MIKIKRVTIGEEKTSVLYDSIEDTVSLRTPVLDLDSQFRRVKQRYLPKAFQSWYIKDFAIYYDKNALKPIRFVIGVSASRGDGKTVFRQEVTNPEEGIMEDILVGVGEAVKLSVKTHLAGL